MKQLNDKYTLYEVVKKDIRFSATVEVQPDITIKTVKDKIPKRVKRFANRHDLTIDLENKTPDGVTAIVGWNIKYNSVWNFEHGGYEEIATMEILIKENRKVRGL